MKASAILILAFALAGCDMGDDEGEVSEASLERGPDLIGLGYPTTGKKGGVSYRVFAAVRDADAAKQGSRVFHDFECGPSCGEHEAGFAWAKRHAVMRPMQCEGETWAAIEGCAAYLMSSNPTLRKALP